MDKLYDNVLDITNNHYKYLLSLKNVNGVGLGFKYINEVNTKEPCIHVLVENKIDAKYLSKSDIIPKTCMGIKTDVILTKKPKMRGIDINKKKFRPLQGGCSITPYNKYGETYFGGTLGCIVTKVVNGVREYFILSNSHVLAAFNKVPIGNKIIQPIFEYGGRKPRDIVANLTSYVPITFIEGDKENINYIDAAIAKLTNGNLKTNRIYSVGHVKGVDTPTLGMEVKKVGFVTGLTFGKIKTVGLEVDLECIDDKEARYKDLMLIEDLENEDGDSGSVILNNENKIVGHFIGGDYDKNGYASTIDKVLDVFNVEVYTGGYSFL